VPETEKEIPRGLSFPESEIFIESKDFKLFTFSRNIKSITINKNQFQELLNKKNVIMAVLLGHVYNNMNFLAAYKYFAEEPIPETLPKSLDTDLGTAYLMQVLHNALADNLKEKGLKQPEMLDCEELWGNRIETFNSLALTVDINDIADTFYYNLWESQEYLLMKPALYVTLKFLTNVSLSTVLSDVRTVLCPPDACEFYF